MTDEGSTGEKPDKTVVTAYPKLITENPKITVSTLYETDTQPDQTMLSAEGGALMIDTSSTPEIAFDASQATQATVPPQTSPTSLMTAGHTDDWELSVLLLAENTTYSTYKSGERQRQDSKQKPDNETTMGNKALQQSPVDSGHVRREQPEQQNDEKETYDQKSATIGLSVFGGLALLILIGTLVILKFCRSR